jgi:hypothetical protein
MVDNKMEDSPVKAAPLPLIPDYDASAIRRIKESHQRETNGVLEKTSITLPVLSSDAGAYELLMFLREFRRAKDILHWTTGPILFQKFEILLQGFHRQAWSEEAEAVGTKTHQRVSFCRIGFHR